MPDLEQQVIAFTHGALAGPLVSRAFVASLVSIAGLYASVSLLKVALIVAAPVVSVA